MLSIYNILTIAKYEIKMLLRSWFFRIFFGLSLSILLLINLGMFTRVGNASWMYRAIPSFIPYMNLLLLNVAQAVIAVFLASEFLKRDEKLDTTEVVYMRSMTNGDYVLGKTFGILTVFIVMNFLILLVTAILSIFFSDVSFNLTGYLLYPIIITLPTLIFIFGLSFLVMVVIRNQAVTFIVLLGFIATTLFFLSHRFHHIFDYMAFYVPLVYSDFTGFGNNSEILIHRGIYFSLGCGFIFSTILLLKRLPQSVLMKNVSVILMILFLTGGLVMGGIYMSGFNRGERIRQNMMDLNNRLIHEQMVSVERCDLDLVHRKNKIQCQAKLVISNKSEESVDTYIFSLNPGLDVQKVVQGNRTLLFDRDFHLLSIHPLNQLLPGSRDSLSIYYKGEIEEETSYLDVDESIRKEPHHIWMYNVDKRHAFITQDFVLLTEENLWYPVAGVNVSSDNPAYHPQEFIRFSLNVKTDQDLTVLSQGNEIHRSNGDVSFHPEVPMPRLSLIIGPYRKRSVTVDSVEYRLFTHKKHGYFEPYLSEIGDTLSVLIREIKNDYERNLDLAYLYPRLSLVEVPVQFFAYKRMWSVARETVQPEMILLPENGILLPAADFKRSGRLGQRQVEQRFREQRDRVVTPKELQSQLFRRFVSFTLLQQTAVNIFRSRESGQSVSDEDNLYSIFPNYYTFIYNIHSKEWPILNIALESFILEKSGNLMVQMARRFSGLTSQEKAKLALDGHSFSELMNDPGQRDLLNDVIQLKGTALFTLIKYSIGKDKFETFLKETLEKHRFQVLDGESWIQELSDQFEFDIKPALNEWYNSKDLPGFILGKVDGYRVLDGNRTRFQVRFRISNPEHAEGYAVITFRGGGGQGGGRSRGMRSMDSGVEYIIQLNANQTKEVGLVLDSPPRMMTLNTLISKNLPSVLTHLFERFELNRNAQPFHGEYVLDGGLDIVESNEVIVDNEDTGFEVYHPPAKSLLKRVLRIANREDDEKYIGMQFWRPPEKWRATTGTNFYGRYIRSAYYVRSGDGKRKVAWNAEILESGYYDLYCYNSVVRRFGRRDQQQQQNDEQYHFIVYHDDGKDEIIFSRQNAETEWNLLGRFYLSPGIAKVELTNESQGRVVVADAIKWVKRD